MIVTWRIEKYVSPSPNLVYTTSENSHKQAYILSRWHFQIHGDHLLCRRLENEETNARPPTERRLRKAASFAEWDKRDFTVVFANERWYDVISVEFQPFQYQRIGLIRNLRPVRHPFVVLMEIAIWNGYPRNLETRVIDSSPVFLQKIRSLAAFRNFERRLVARRSFDVCLK